MIIIKSQYDIERMREAGQIAGEALYKAGEAVRPGVTTEEIDRVVRQTIEGHGAIPSSLGYGGFPGSACISINDEVIHGIPGKRVVNEGDIVKVDVTAQYKGFQGDNAATFAAGGIAPEAQRLIDVTRQSFYEGIAFAREGQRISDISHAVQSFVEAAGYSVVRDFVGHGIGTEMHEDPEVPNFGEPGHGPRLRAGMTICVEPMVCAGRYNVRVMPDKWTVKTCDGSLAAHYEHTILITSDEPILLTEYKG